METCLCTEKATRVLLAGILLFLNAWLARSVFELQIIIYRRQKCAKLFSPKNFPTECPNGAGGKGTPLSVSETNNPMYDMTGRDVADWMVKTTDR